MEHWILRCWLAKLITQISFVPEICVFLSGIAFWTVKYFPKSLSLAVLMWPVLIYFTRQLGNEVSLIEQLTISFTGLSLYHFSPVKRSGFSRHVYLSSCHVLCQQITKMSKNSKRPALNLISFFLCVTSSKSFSNMSFYFLIQKSKFSI